MSPLPPRRDVNDPRLEPPSPSSPTTVIGRPGRELPARGSLPDILLENIGRDIAAPPPLLLLPLRLEYRVVQTNVPFNIASNVAAVLRNNPGIAVDTPASPRTSPDARAAAPRFRLDPTTVRFTAQREIWFRWFPDEDFVLHGIAPAGEEETAALARFAAASGGKPWHALDDAAVVSAWQALSREVSPERALHLLRHRGEPGDPNHLAQLGRIALLPDRVALFALGPSGPPTLLGEGGPIDQALRYSMANLQAGGWHTDFDAALNAGMGMRLTAPDVVARALAASWIIAVGLSTADGAAAVSALIDDAVANGAFAFLRQDSPTNNTPHEPTPYQSPRADLLAFLRTAADAEKGVLASPLTQSAELLAEALGVDLPRVATAPDSGDLALEDARAMLRVIGPALIDTAVDSTAALAGIAEDVVIEFFAEAVAARGPLPPVRFGKNPYGVLPVIDLSSLAPLASDSDIEKRIEAFVRDFATLVIGESQDTADAAVPVLQPGDPDAAAKLEAILKLHPVSRRLEVGTVGVNDAKSLGCDYVANSAHPVATYVADLARRPISQLPDPTATETEFPLLYRLARLTLAKSTILTAVADATVLARTNVNTRMHLTQDEQQRFDRVATSVGRRSLAAIASDRIPGDRPPPILQAASGRLLAALQRLEAIASEPDGVAKLETLLMETVDVFQHRIDAWATGIAYRRLVKRRRSGRAGLVGGHWGLLGRLRVDQMTGRTDGYLQAPSQHQAATAAILRSAHLRHQDTGAFAIGLDSVRVRRGLKLLDMLQAGISPGEALGYIAERKLHDNKQDILIFTLRDLFPLRDPRDEGALETRLSDGLAFLNSSIPSSVPAADAQRLRSLQDELRQDFDALSDIVMAEATHLRAMGQADAANGWLQVLSGETVPGMPSVLRTRRHGHGSTHRVAVLIDPAEPKATDAPRAIAEPALASLAASQLTRFSTAVVRVTVAAGDGRPAATRQFRLAADLGLTPFDLLVGGESEIVLRARHRLVSLWRTDPRTLTELGPLPDRDVVSFINQTRPVTIDLDAGQTSVRKLLDAAAELRRTVANGRMLEPGDLSAAADPAVKLTDALERDLVAESSAALARRATLLAARLNADLAALRMSVGPLIASARNYRRLIDSRADAAQLVIALAQLEALRPALDTALLALSRYAEPIALRLFTTTEIAADPDEFERAFGSLGARLAARAGGLLSAIPPAALPATASVARGQRDALVSALRSALDGDAQPVLPPLRRIPATTPLLGPDVSAVQPALRDWMPVRAKIARVAAVFGDAPWRARLTTAAATGADDPESDPRSDEGVAPRARLFGTFVSKADPAAAATFAGFVGDEWAEQRPSRMQHTGVAINYDSPQSEPPHALLLCEPSGPSAPAWSAAAAAGIVARTIALMKTRALAAQDRPLPGPLFPFANQIAFKQVLRGTAKPRIPVRPFRFNPAIPFGRDATFLADPTARDVGVSGSGFFEISGRGKARE